MIYLLQFEVQIVRSEAAWRSQLSASDCVSTDSNVELKDFLISNAKKYESSKFEGYINNVLAKLRTLYE